MKRQERQKLITSLRFPPDGLDTTGIRFDAAAELERMEKEIDDLEERLQDEMWAAMGEDL